MFQNNRLNSHLSYGYSRVIKFDKMLASEEVSFDIYL